MSHTHNTKPATTNDSAIRTVFALEDLVRALVEDPAVRTKAKKERMRRFREQDALAARDVERRMRHLRERPQESNYHDGYKSTQAQGSGASTGKVKLQHKPRTRTLATVAISYKLRNRKLYWYRHDPTVMFNYYARGVITDGEWNEYVANVNLMS